MGVWEGRLVVFESLVNQQIHPLSFSSFSLSLYHSLSPSSPPPTPSLLPPPPSLTQQHGLSQQLRKNYTPEREKEKQGERGGLN